jgi:hypothetical protein
MVSSGVDGVIRRKRGAWVKLKFMRRAQAGLTVTKPWGESRSYDSVVEEVDDSRGEFPQTRVWVQRFW